jgi:spore coat polysaccharide biosynthesis protein SpsF
MKIACIIASRMSSTRLPEKAMMKILGKPMLEQLVNRVHRSKLIDEIVVATTIDPNDYVIIDLAKRIGVNSYAGSSEDVLGRTLEAAKSIDADIIVQINGDCPLIDPEISDIVIKKYLEKEPDYATNALKKTFPLGLNTEVFSVEILDKVDKITNDSFDREHVTLYIYEHPKKYKLLNIEAPPELRKPDLRLTVDTIEDITLVRKIYNALYPKNPFFTIKDVINLFEKNPRLKEINASIRQRNPRKKE